MHLDIVSNKRGSPAKSGMLRFSLLACLTAFLASGCASLPDTQQKMQSGTAGTSLIRTGYVSDVRDVAIQDHSRASGAPAIGALVGGVAGSLIGSGSGRMLGAVGGAAGGSLAAQRLARPEQSTVTKVTVRFEDGSSQIYEVDLKESFRIGEPVKVVSHHGDIRLMR